MKEWLAKALYRAEMGYWVHWLYLKYELEAARSSRFIRLQSGTYVRVD